MIKTVDDFVGALGDLVEEGRGLDGVLELQDHQGPGHAQATSRSPRVIRLVLENETVVLVSLVGFTAPVVKRVAPGRARAKAKLSVVKSATKAKPRKSAAA